MAAPELWETADLLEVTYDDNAAPPDGFWLQFFPRTYTSTAEQIFFDDIMPRDRRLAPFVAPNVQGKIMRSRGFNLKSFKPAYIKPKHKIDLAKALTRRRGEPLGGINNGSLTLQQRFDAYVAAALVDERDMAERRFDWMACQALAYGQVVVAGDDYPSTTVDFGRDASLTYTLSGAAQWDDPDSSPLADIKAGRLNARLLGRSRVSNLIFGSDAWSAFSAHDDIQDLLDRMKSGAEGTSIDRTGITDEIGGEYVGRIAGNQSGGALDLWIYANDYEDDDGNLQPYLNPADVIGVGAGVGGVQCFGAIMDEEAGLQAMRLFPRTYREPGDPGGTFTLTQSAPLMVPTNVNNSFRIRAL